MTGQDRLRDTVVCKPSPRESYSSKEGGYREARDPRGSYSGSSREGYGGPAPRTRDYSPAPGSPRRRSYSDSRPSGSRSAIVSDNLALFLPKSLSQQVRGLLHERLQPGSSSPQAQREIQVPRNTSKQLSASINFLPPHTNQQLSASPLSTCNFLPHHSN